MSRPNNPETMRRRVLVAISLLGLDENGRRRTQNEVCQVLALSKSTVSTYVKWLLDNGYIQESGRSNRDKLYARGPAWPLLESQISDEIRQNLRDLRSVQKTRDPTSHADRAESSEARQKVNTSESRVSEDRGAANAPVAWEVHPSGHNFMFEVEREGSIDRTPVSVTDPSSGEPKTVFQTIFGSQEPYELDGSVNWSTPFVLEAGKSYVLRYQRSAKVRRFYVTPQFEILVSSEAAQDFAQIMDAFLLACNPVLMWLEKHAGWRFVKDERGRYAMLSDIKEKDVHRAYRGPLNDVVTDLTGGTFVGNDQLWADNSPGYTELETNQPAYIEALLDMPLTRQRVNAMWSEFPAIKEDLARLLEEVTIMVQISHRLYEITENLVRAGINTQRHILGSNQTTFDRYMNLTSEQPSPKDDKTQTPGDEKNPPEGYQ